MRTAEALDPERIELSVLHLQTHGPLRSRYERLGVRMTHIPIPSLYSPRSILQGFRAAALLRRWNIDVVHTHDLYTNIFMVPWARLLTRCSIVASRRWWYVAPRPELVTANHWSCSLAHRILANSSGVARLLADAEGVSAKKVVEVPNFLSEEAFSTIDDAGRRAQLAAWGVPEGAFVVGIVARLQPVKNHELLLNALARLDSRFHAVLIGDGPSRVPLEAMARRLGIEPRVHFAGEVVSAQNLHRCFDVSVLCSHSESFPNSVIEAMAASRAVVATPVGGVMDAVKDGTTGLLVPVDDPSELARTLQMLEDDAELRSRLGESSRRFVREKFGQEVVIEKLSGLYESLAHCTHSMER